MHVDRKLVEFMPIDEQEYDEVIEEYEEEILVQEEALEPFRADPTDRSPAQGNPRCITPILWSLNTYIWCAFTLQAFYGNYMHKYIYLWVLLA